MPSYPSPAFDINGTEVTIDLEGGDYGNLPAGYYVSPGQAAVARGVPPAASGAPITAQAVAELYADPDPENQSAIQEFFDDPPPPSEYVAPLAPVAIGWVPPPVSPPPTPAQIIAQNYVDQGYTPPPAPVIAQIISGAIVAPLTEPLTPAHAVDPAPILVTAAPPPPQNPVDASEPSAQTATTAPAAMPTPAGVLNDTAAFTIGHDVAGLVVMQLVDSAGTLLQWTLNAAGNGYAVQPFVVTAPMAINQKRLVGDDAAGNPVFQMLDTDRNLLQWTENKGQTDYIVPPFYVRDLLPAAGGNAAGGATAGNNSGTPLPASSPYFDPAHRSIGWGAEGKEYFVQIDEHGDVITYASDGTNLRNRGQATMDAAGTAAALSMNYFRTNPRLSGDFGTVTQTGGGNQNTGGGGASVDQSTAGNGDVSPFFDPTHRSIGWAIDGKERFIQIDEAGYILSYNSDNTFFQKLGKATANAAATAAAMLAQNPYKTNPLLNQGGGGGGSTTTTATQEKNSYLPLLVGAGVGLLLWRASKSRA